MKFFNKYIAAIFVLGLFLLPSVNAQTLDFSQLVAVSEDTAPEDRFTKKVELTADALKKASERVTEMRSKLEGISLEEESPEWQLQNTLIALTGEYATFYEEQSKRLAEVTTIDDVNLLIDEIIAYRESVYAPGAKEILEFALVHSYTPSVLDLANQRLENIRADVNKLEGLGLVETDVFQAEIAEADGVLREAEDLHSQAIALLMDNYATSLLEPQEATTTDQLTADELELVVTPKSLAEESLTKIKSLYELFMATGERVTQALGIGS